MNLKARWKDFVSGFKKKVYAVEHYDMHGYKNKRKFVIGLAALFVIVVLSVSFFTGGALKSRSLTGLVVQHEGTIEDLSGNLEALNSEIDSKTQELTSAQGDLEIQIKEVENLRSQIEFRDTKVAEYVAQVSDLENEAITLRGDNDELKDKNEELKDDVEKYTDAIESSAWSICCSFSDFQDGKNKDWDIVDGEIQCDSGSYTVECDSGDTDFE